MASTLSSRRGDAAGILGTTLGEVVEDSGNGTASLWLYFTETDENQSVFDGRTKIRQSLYEVQYK